MLRLSEFKNKNTVVKNEQSQLFVKVKRHKEIEFNFLSSKKKPNIFFLTRLFLR